MRNLLDLIQYKKRFTMKIFLKKAMMIAIIMVISFLPSTSNATSYNILMTEGTSVHRGMESIPHYPSLWSGTYGYPADYLITYLKFDLTSILDTELVNSIILTGSQSDQYNQSGNPSIKAYYVNDDTLGGNSYPSLTYNQFHTVNQYLGTGTEIGNNWSWNISGYDYSGDINNNVLTIALASFDYQPYNYSYFNRDLSLAISTTPPAVPEPSTLLLFGSFAVGLVGMKRKFKIF